jgi:hypothetical protein
MCWEDLSGLRQHSAALLCRTRWRETRLLREDDSDARVAIERLESTANMNAGLEELVPIRIEFFAGDTFVNELFTWNQHETSVTPSEFATQLVADLGLPSQSISIIATSIQEQLAAAAEANPSTSFDTTAGVSRFGRLPETETEAVGVTEESRRIVKLSVRVGRVVLKDQFEWDVGNEDNSPEGFAETLSADLGLSRNFVPAIAHGVREQLRDTVNQRRHAIGPSLNGRTAIRAPSAVQAFEPVVECLSMTQQDNIQRKEKREARMARRILEPVPTKGGRATGKRRVSAASD